MSRTTSENITPGNSRHDERGKSHGAAGELQVVLKSGGVYCFVRRPKSSCAELPPAAMVLDEARGLIPIDG